MRRSPGGICLQDSSNPVSAWAWHSSPKREGALRVLEASTQGCTLPSASSSWSFFLQSLFLPSSLATSILGFCSPC